MTYISGAAIFWTALFVLLGMARGVWKSLSAIVGLVAALASLSFVVPVTDWVLRQWPVLMPQRTLLLWVSGILLFILAGLLARLAVQSFGRLLPLAGTSFNRVGGAMLGGLYGATLGVFLVWGAAFLAETWPVNAEHRTVEPVPPVVQFSREVVAELVAWHMARSGADPDAVQWGKAVAQRPTTVLRSVQETVQSPEFQGLLQDPEAQQLVAQRDAEGLRNHPAFQELLAQPAAQRVRSVLGREDQPLSDQLAAEQVMRILHNLERVKNDPEVQALLNDPELETFVREQAPLTPALYPKVQQLFRRVISLEADTGRPDTAPPAAIEKPAPTTVKSS